MPIKPCEDCGEYFDCIFSTTERCSKCFDIWLERSKEDRAQSIRERDADDPCDQDFMKDISS